MRAAPSGLRHPASASCLGRHSRLAGRCPNNSSLFPPLAAVVVVAVAGWVESRGREGGVGTPLPASGPAERPCTLMASKSFPTKAQSFQARQRLPPRGSWQNRQVLTEGVRSTVAFAKNCFFRKFVLDNRPTFRYNRARSRGKMPHELERSWPGSSVG